jgi:hypothetical protein
MGKRNKIPADQRCAHCDGRGQVPSRANQPYIKNLRCPVCLGSGLNHAARPRVPIKITPANIDQAHDLAISELVEPVTSSQ